MSKNEARLKIVNFVMSHPIWIIIILAVIFAGLRWLSCSYEVGDKIKVDAGVHLNVNK